MAHGSGLRAPVVRQWIAGLGVLLGLADLLAAIWIVLPPPSHVLVPLAVGAPELCGWLGAMALTAAGLTATGSRRSFVRRGGLLCAIAALALAALPLARFGSVARAAAAARRT